MKIDQYGKAQSLLAQGLVIAVATLFFLATASAQAPGRHMLNGSISTGVFQAALAPGGSLPPSQVFNLAISLPVHNQSTLDATLADLYNPASPNFHHWLTTDQYVTQFGPTPQDVTQVAAFAQKYGLTVTKVHANRMIVDVSGPVSVVEAAFGVKMHNYLHPTEERVFYGPDTAPSVDAGVPVLGVSGLENFVLPRPANLVKANVVRANAAGSGPGSGFIGNDFRAAYAPGVSLTGSGQSIAIFALGTTCYTGDLNSYTSQAGIAPVNIRNVLLNGVSSTPSGDTFEQSLDVEVAHALAPGANIVYYVGNSATDIWNQIAVDNSCKAVTTSWYVSPPPATMTQMLQQMQAQGQSVFDASGDTGFGVPSGWDDNPNLTSVGGTTLTAVSAGGLWQSEVGWSGSSGGISPTFAIPSWQQGISMSASGGSTTMRNIPDVSMVGVNVYVACSNGASVLGTGTSVAAPLWAGFMALVNQQAASANKPTAGFINPAVYAILKGASYPFDFHDITSGNNGKPCVTGYDLVTGIGTPTGQPLINALSGVGSEAYTRVAGEGGTVNLSVPADLAYGANGSYFYLYAQTGNIAFNPATFGGDPDPGVSKSGYSSLYTQCAGEGGSATFTVPVEAAYGAQGKYFYKRGVSGTVAFNANTFGGDPNFGVSKAGYYMPYMQCTGEGGSFTFSSPTDVAYGANGRYYFLYGVTGTIAFNPTTFGGDPNFGVVKAGYYRPSGPTPIAGVYSIQSTGDSGKALQATGDPYYNGSSYGSGIYEVAVTPYNNGWTYQQWTVTPIGNGQYHIINKADGLSLQATGDAYRNAGGNIVGGANKIALTPGSWNLSQQVWTFNAGAGYALANPTNSQNLQASGDSYKGSSSNYQVLGSPYSWGVGTYQEWNLVWVSAN